jgi:hypothetical protein
VILNPLNTKKSVQNMVCHPIADAEIAPFSTNSALYPSTDDGKVVAQLADGSDGRFVKFAEVASMTGRRCGNRRAKSSKTRYKRWGSRQYFIRDVRSRTT